MDKSLKAAVAVGGGLLVRKWLRDQIERELQRQGVDPKYAGVGAFAIVAIAIWAFQK